MTTPLTREEFEADILTARLDPDAIWHDAKNRLLAHDAALRARLAEAEAALAAIADDMERIVCECGEPYAGTDPHETAKRYLAPERPA